MRSLELFAGAGGLGLGLASAGFDHLALIERDPQSCETIRANKTRLKIMKDWHVLQQDVRTVNFGDFPEDLDLVSGGVPCQPFSIGGKHRGHDDSRNMFPEMLRAVSSIRPKAILIENVKGLTRKSFAQYFGFLNLALAYPEVALSRNLPWEEMNRELQRYHTGAREKGLHYRVVTALVNAANFGIPQQRERVILVGIRSDLGKDFSFPLATNSKASLLFEQHESKAYWKRHGIRSPRADGPVVVSAQYELNTLKSWRTVRDSIGDLPTPHKARDTEFGHFLIPGARSYPGHTGSPLDSPAKTLKAGDHGVPGGENMLRKPDGSVRYFSIRESARLQTFPDEFVFPRSWTETMRQIGNAVPVELATLVGNKLYATLSADNNGGTEVQSTR